MLLGDEVGVGDVATISALRLFEGQMAVPAVAYPAGRLPHSLLGSGLDGRGMVFNSEGLLLYEVLDADGGHALCLADTTVL